MSLLNVLEIIVIGGLFSLEFFSVIAWLVCMLTDRKNLQRRKKYATMCLVSIVALILIMIVSFILNFKRNTM